WRRGRFLVYAGSADVGQPRGVVERSAGDHRRHRDLVSYPQLGDGLGAAGDCSDVATVVRFHVQAHFFVLRGHGFTVHDRGDVLAGPRGVPVCTVAAGTVRAVVGRGRLVRGGRRRVLVFLSDLDRCVDSL